MSSYICSVFLGKWDALQAEEEVYVKMMEQYGMEHRQEKQKTAQKKCDKRKEEKTKSRNSSLSKISAFLFFGAPDRNISGICLI